MIKRIFYSIKKYLSNIRFLRICKQYLQTLRAKVFTDRHFIIKQYRKHFDHSPNLHNPVLFTEKIQWLKLNYRNQLYPICADKYRVRNYVADKIGKGYLIPLLFVSGNPKEFLDAQLPDNFIIKTNHTSGYNLIVKDGYIEYLDKKIPYDSYKVYKILKEWLRTNVYYINREWEYKNIPPKYLIEKLLSDESGNEVLNDYKIHCFHGKPLYIQTIFDRKENVKENWFDTKWNSLNLYYFSKQRKNIPKPTNLERMIEIASILSNDFIYVRVDLYSVRNKIYFGELTFHPYSGVMNFSPKYWDKKLGDLIEIPKL